MVLYIIATWLKLTKCMKYVVAIIISIWLLAFHMQSVGGGINSSRQRTCDPMCELLELLVMSTRLSREHMMKWNRLLPQSVD